MKEVKEKEKEKELDLKLDLKLDPNLNNNNEIIIEKKIEKGIIQKQLKILVINGKEPGKNGENWTVSKALVQNGIGENEVKWNGSNFIGDEAKVIELKEEEIKIEENLQMPINNNAKINNAKIWDGKACRCNGGSVDVMTLSPNDIAQLSNYAADADVVVLLDSDELGENVLNDKSFEDLPKYRKVILYGSGNKNLDKCWPSEYSAKCVHLESEDGCENLLKCIQERVVPGLNSNFVGQKGIFNEVKKYAKNNPKKTTAGMVAGAGIIEELVGQLGFGKSILGTIFGYNSNPKEKDAKNVKDNKKDEKKSNKEVNNSGNHVK